MNFKQINIGKLIEQRVAECGIEMSRICNFFKYSEEEIVKIYMSASLDSDMLLRWSKLLEYDFFRLYSQHLILYAPPSSLSQSKRGVLTIGSVPQFRKNIYTKELIEFILELIFTKKKSISEIVEEYKIPKTTLYKWISKYKI